MSKKKKHVSGNPVTRKLKDFAANEFRNFRVYVNEMVNNEGKKLFLPGGEVKRRRIEAIVNYTPVIREKFGKKYTGFNTGELLSHFCTSDSLAFKSIGGCDELAHWSLAAALWILDELKASGRLSELNLDDYKNPVGFNSYVPDLVDFVHPSEILKPMVTLIQMQMMDIGNDRLMFNSDNATYGNENSEKENKAHSDFLKVIELLDTEHVQYAVDELEAKIMEVIEHYFKCMKIGISEICRESHVYAFTKDLSMIILSSSNYETLKSHYIPEIVDKKIEDFAKKFSVSNPYAICFAVFYLIAKGSDLVWLYTPVMPILKHCWNIFPWSVRSEVFYALCIEEEEPWDIFNSNHWAATIAKGILPRNMTEHEKSKDKMIEFGYEEERAEHLADIIDIVSAHYDYVKQTEEIHKAELENLKAEMSGKVSVEKVIISDNSNDKKLRAEIMSLENKLKTARHENSVLQKKFNDMEDEHKLEKQELNALRELVYHLEEETETTENVASVKMPYRTREKRIVCIGGTESWLKKIKEFLPDVKFCKPDVNTNIDTFKYADEIWVQRSGLMHSESFDVKNISRTRNIPIEFFNGLNPQKCAEQVARHDIQLKKAG